MLFRGSVQDGLKTAASRVTAKVNLLDPLKRLLYVIYNAFTSCKRNAALISACIGRSSATLGDAVPVAAQPYTQRSISKLAIVSGVSLASAAAAFVYGAQQADMPLPLFYEHSIRFCRTGIVGAIISADYKWSFRGVERGDPKYNELRKVVGLRAAKRLLWLCKENRGIYIKAGQHIASMNHVLPPEFTNTLSVLQDQAEPRSFEEVVQAFQSQLGAHPDDIFDQFEKNAVAAASLAQVHRARLRDTGETVAVKVQYPDMDNMFKGDMKTIEIMMNLIGRVRQLNRRILSLSDQPERFIFQSFPSFQFSWLLPDFRSALESELDFVNEAKNSERAASLFGNNRNIYIPKIHWKTTTRKILTMEWVDGVKINDVEGIQQLGMQLSTVSRILIDLLSEQIFIHGFIHSDPHPGNILVRLKPARPSEPQIVLLDHGLYQSFPDHLRVPYCKLWRALLLRNRDDIEKYGRQLGAGEHYNLLSIILSFRPIQNDAGIRSRDVGLSGSMSPEDLQQIRSIFKGKTPQENVQMINNLLESLPRELLLVLRTTNLLRAANKDLGALVNRFMVMARWSLKGAHTSASGQTVSFTEKMSYWFDLGRFEFILALFETRKFIQTAVRWFTGLIGQPAPAAVAAPHQ